MKQTQNFFPRAEKIHFPSPLPGHWMGEPGWHSPWALNVLPNPAVLASFLPLAIILSPPDTTHKVLPPRGLQKGLVGLLNLPSRTIYVNEPGKGLNMFQVWKNTCFGLLALASGHVFWCFCSVGWRGSGKAVAVWKVVPAHPRFLPQTPRSHPSSQ